LVIKKIEWSYWKGILLVKNQEELEDIMEMLSDSFNKLNINLLLQEYIWEKPGSDLRLFVVWGKVIASMLRKWKKWDFKANYSGGWSAYEHKPTKEEKEIAIQAAKIIGLDIAGVDLLFDKDNGYRICEINGSPWFEWLEQATGKNIAESIMKYIASKKKGK
jgi:RimK family alpha-L-glutamate ligase